MEPNKSTPRDFFLYLLSAVTLYLSAFSVITLVFQYLNAAFPDSLSPNYGLGDTVRWFLAMLIIVFPVYLWTLHTVNRDREREPAKGEIKVRKWLMYLTIFLAAALVIGDLVALIYSFLQGELSVRFGLKVLTVLAVGASVFGYYLFDLRRASAARTQKVALMEWAAILAILAVVIGGFFVAGSPLNQRKVKQDAQKISDIQNLQYQIEQYWITKTKLPATLADLQVLGGLPPTKDAQSGKDYEYRTTGVLSYELCAEFNLPAAKGDELRMRGLEPAMWNHGAGRQCFSRSIDPDVLGQRFPYKPGMPVPATPF
jgi:hypothetical protein